MICHDRLSGEKFEADSDYEIRQYIRDGLNPGETVAYEVETDDGRFFLRAR